MARIPIVDDDPHIAESLRERFSARGFYTGVAVAGVGAHHFQARVVLVVVVMPLEAGGEIIVQGYRLLRRIGQQAVGEVAADEPGAADDQDPAGLPGGLRQRMDSHLVSDAFNAGWLTRRCQITAARPSVWGVRRSGARGGTTTQTSAHFAV